MSPARRRLWLGLLLAAVVWLAWRAPDREQADAGMPEAEAELAVLPVIRRQYRLPPDDAAEARSLFAQRQAPMPAAVVPPPAVTAVPPKTVPPPSLILLGWIEQAGRRTAFLRDDVAAWAVGEGDAIGEAYVAYRWRGDALLVRHRASGQVQVISMGDGG